MGFLTCGTALFLFFVSFVDSTLKYKFAPSVYLFLPFS